MNVKVVKKASNLLIVSALISASRDVPIIHLNFIFPNLKFVVVVAVHDDDDDDA